MTHRTRAAAVFLVVAAACGGDTGGSEAFCDAARDYARTADADEALDALGRMRTEAPSEVEDAVNTFADLTEEGFETGDPTLTESQEYQDANEELETYLEANCEAPEEG